MRYLHATVRDSGGLIAAERTYTEVGPTGGDTTLDHIAELLELARTKADESGNGHTLTVSVGTKVVGP